MPISSQLPAVNDSYVFLYNLIRITEIANVLVDIGSSIAPPNLLEKKNQLVTLDLKRFVRGLRSGKVKQICVLFTKDKYVADIRSTILFPKNERIVSSLSTVKSVLDEKTSLK